MFCFSLLLLMMGCCFQRTSLQCTHKGGDVVRFFIQSVLLFVCSVLWICWQCVANRPKFLNFISFRSLLFDVCARAYFRRSFSVVTFFSTFVQKFKKHFKCRCIPRQHSRQFVSEQIALWTMGFARKRGKSVCLCAEWINLLSNPCAKKA